MGFNWDSLLEPVFLFILTLVAGTLWIIVPLESQALTTPPHLAIAPIAKIDPKPADAATARADLTAKLQQAEESAKKETVQLAADVQSLDAAEQQVAQETRQEEQRMSGVESQLQSLDQHQVEVRERIDRLRKQNATREAEAERLERQARDQERDIAVLREELQTTPAVYEGDRQSVPRVVQARKLPILLELVGNRAVPVDKEHFHFHTPLLGGPAQAVRYEQGETQAELAAADSDFMRLLDRIKPGDQYLACLLNPDSFTVYRSVRRIARKQGIDVGWEPINTQDGRITIYPVHFKKDASAKNKGEKSGKLPRVTSILQ